LKIDALDVHHFLAEAQLLVSDSQSMSVEAAMLGTPSVRFSDFAGRIGVLEELEHEYQLTRGIRTSEPERLIDVVRDLASQANLRELAADRRKLMLSHSTDVAAFVAGVVDGFPASIDLCGRAVQSGATAVV
jgi:predicted glycosyltransferase